MNQACIKRGWEDSSVVVALTTNMKEEDLKEKNLYELIKEALLERFQETRECHLEVTAERIPDNIRRELSANSWKNLLVENRRPDIMGYAVETPETEKRLIVVEVKKGSLKLEHVYQAKMYADMFRTNNPQPTVFLISPSGLREKRERILKEEFAFLRTAINVIYIMRYDLDGGKLTLYREFYRKNPFTLEWFK